MACVDHFDAFRIATEDLDRRIFPRASYSAIYLNLIERSMYEYGRGTTHQVFGTADNEPVSEEVWTPVTFAQDGEAGVDACTKEWNDVEWGHFEDSYSPEKFHLRGPPVCREELKYSHAVDAFLENYTNKMAIRAQRSWELRYEALHVQFSRKAIAVPDFEGSFADQEALTGLEEATCELTQEMLEIVAQYLILDGAGVPNSNGYITFPNEGPALFMLNIGMQQSMRLLRQNSELRQDIRYSDPNMLLARIGATKTLGNFTHIQQQMPRRYTFAGGAYTYVPRFVDATAGDAPTKGSGQKVNPAWRTAPFEGVEVLSRNLFTSEVPGSFNGAGDVRFPPAEYMGKWVFKTGKDAFGDVLCLDPFEDRGRHFAQFEHAPKPNLTGRFRHGYEIIYERCLGPVECTTCSS